MNEVAILESSIGSPVFHPTPFSFLPMSEWQGEMGIADESPNARPTYMSIIDSRTRTTVSKLLEDFNNRQETGASTVRDFEHRICLVASLYTFRRSEEVLSFLNDCPFLVQLLIEARNAIARCFGEFQKVALEVVTDPEAENDRELFAFIQTNLEPNDALDKLDRLDQEWWLAESDRAKSKLCIHVEFE